VLNAEVQVRQSVFESQVAQFAGQETQYFLVIPVGDVFSMKRDPTEDVVHSASGTQFLAHG
jgi:hypothetical protein